MREPQWPTAPGVWAKYQSISDVEHLVAAKLLRRDRFDPVRSTVEPDVESRDLANYHIALGVEEGVS